MRTEPSFSAKPEELLSDDASAHQEEAGSPHESDSNLEEAQHLAEYRQRYGLSVDPFADDQHFPFYTGGQRRQILDQLLHLCQFSNNILVVLGGYSIGKTRMAQALIDSLDDADDICFLEGQVTSSFDSLMKNILDQFELPDIETFEEFVKRQSESDGLAVLIIDNAHHLADDVLLQLINLVGIDTRVHVVFFAETHLLPRLQLLDIRDLIVSDFGLMKFSLAETVDYLNFRMEMADYLGPELFTEANLESWWRQSRGQLLELHEYARDKLLSAAPVARKKVDYGKKTLPVPHIVGAAALGAMLIMGLIYWSGESSQKEPQKLTTIPIPIPQASEHSLAAQQSVTASAVAQSSVVTAAAQAAAPATNDALNGSPVSAAAVSVAASTPTTSNVAVPPPEAQVLKQSVVPLVQTNAMHQAATEKSLKASSVAATKDVKKIEAPAEKASIEKIPAEKAPLEKAAPAKVDVSADKSAAAKVDVPAEKIAGKKVELPVPREAVKKIEAQPVEKTKTSAEMGTYAEQEKTLLSWAPTDFTLQLVGVSSEKAVHDFVEQQPNKKDLLVFKSIRQGKDWFVVVTGRYPSAAKARQASQLLPESQKKAAPWPRDLQTIKKEIQAK